MNYMILSMGSGVRGSVRGPFFYQAPLNISKIMPAMPKQEIVFNKDRATLHVISK